ncbi:hypothetical protein [Leifsonia aquatica]|uniref:hypothetical protein n=1 Tax=Leifsonia aquatica TaxID=144185 RepID=UPI0038091B80
MKPYTPAEIIQAGRDEIRQAHAHLYVQLDTLRAEAAYLYHLAFIDAAVDVDERGRLPFHPAPAGFGGNEVATIVRTVYLNRLTQKGFALYELGARQGWADVLQLEHDIDQAEHDLEQMHIELATPRALLVKQVERGIDVATNRGRSAAEAVAGAPTQVTGWDVPVRIPGTTTYTPCHTA